MFQKVFKFPFPFASGSLGLFLEDIMECTLRKKEEKEKKGDAAGPFRQNKGKGKGEDLNTWELFVILVKVFLFSVCSTALEHRTVALLTRFLA